MSFKKKLLITIIIFCLLFGTFVLYRAYLDTKYSLEEVKKIIALSFKESDNLFYKKEYLEEKDKIDFVEYNYKKDTKSYRKLVKDDDVIAETFLDEEFVINVNYSEKLIFKSSILDTEEIKPEDNNSFYITIKQNELYNHLGVYEFIKNDFINGRQCIKVLVKSDYADDNKVLSYYWIDIKTGNILKEEYYKNEEYEYGYLYTYEENSVTDSDIKEFNETEYVDFNISSSN